MSMWLSLYFLPILLFYLETERKLTQVVQDNVTFKKKVLLKWKVLFERNKFAKNDLHMP